MQYVIFCAALFAAAAAAVPAAAQQHSQNEAADAAISCLDIADDGQRLTCLETATRDLKATRVRREDAVEPPAAAVSPPAESAADSTEEESFGAENLDSVRREKREDTRRFRLEAKVIEFKLDPYGDFTATLDNGQVWRQLTGNTSKAHFGNSNRLYTVTIKKGPLKNYRMKINELGRWYRVKRVK